MLKISDFISGSNIFLYEALLRQAMTVSDALNTLGFDLQDHPSKEEVGKAYKKKAFENHPDRGGDLHKMVEINVAKDVLEGKQRPTHRSETRTKETWPSAPKKEEVTEVTWNEAKAKAKIPISGVTWKFITKVEHEKLTGYDGEGGIFGFVVYGINERNHIFVAVEWRQFKSLDVDHSIWWMKKYEYPIGISIITLAPKGIRRGFENFPHLEASYRDKVAILKEDCGFTVRDLFTPNPSHKYMNFKDAMLLLGNLDKDDPKIKNRKFVVILQLSEVFGKHDTQVASIQINGEVFKLHDDSIRKMSLSNNKAGTAFFSLIFGNYWHQGGKKTLTLMGQKGLKILQWMIKNLNSEPEELKTLLQTAADHMEKKKK